MASSTQAAEELAGLAVDPGTSARRVSGMAAGLVGSEILRIAGEIRALVASGREVCDLTVGDFAPRHFPIPARLLRGVVSALEAGETNYPPSSGMPQLRSAVQRFYARRLSLDYPLDSCLVAGGSRPIIYALFRAVCDPGDRVVYPVPSWNNNHYTHMVGGVAVPLSCGPEDRFLPTPEMLRPLLPGARLLCLNSPLNPAGTAFSAESLRAICELVLAENEARVARGERPLFVMYDHVYWMLTFGDVRHVTPPALLPQMARYTIFVDGISKAFAATGVRVGWALGPVDVIGRMSSILGHVGAWAPRAEQVATAALLDDTAAVDEFRSTFLRSLQERLLTLHDGLQALRSEGLPVDSIAPMGAIYLTARIHPFGARRADGSVLRTNEDIRRHILDTAGIAVVPFQAFGDPRDEGWFRLSVGAIGTAEIAPALRRLGASLQGLQQH